MSGGIVCEGLVKVYKTADVEVVALQGLDLFVEPGELVAVVGASGSGKSTLQSILAGLETPTAGRVSVAGFELAGLDARRRREYRLSSVGFVWQQTAANVVPYLRVDENIAVPLLLARANRLRRLRRIREVLELTGIEELARERAETLSGGEQQRLALAVALANEPAVVLADEPTAELDAASSGELFAALQNVCDTGVTVLVTTHDPQVATSVERTITIRDGRTSVETLRAPGSGGTGEEFAVLDSQGRLQLPAEHVAALGLRRRVRLRLRDGSLEIRPQAERPEGDE